MRRGACVRVTLRPVARQSNLMTDEYIRQRMDRSTGHIFIPVLAQYKKVRGVCGARAVRGVCVCVCVCVCV
jgi:hypothetical protein